MHHGKDAWIGGQGYPHQSTKRGNRSMKKPGQGKELSKLSPEFEDSIQRRPIAVINYVAVASRQLV